MENKIIFQTTTKTGKILTFRYPAINDLQMLTDFINKASKEKTFINFQGTKIKLEDEKKWLESTIKKNKSKEKIYLMAFVDNKLAGASDIELDNFTKRHNGVFGIIIDDNYRGEGIGEALMKLVISEAKKNIKELKIIVLECFAPYFDHPKNYLAEKLFLNL
jgi:predicted acetyltransferase